MEADRAMLDRTTASLNYWLARTKHWVSLWTITRSDGTVLRFTSHDHEIRYPMISSQTFTPAGGFDGSARQRIDGMKDHTVDFRGIIHSDFLTVDDLRAGKYRDAKVTETVVDFRFPWVPLFEETWWVDQTTFDSEIWTAEMSGPTRFLKRRIGDVFDRTCDRTLFDTFCGLSRATYTDSSVSVIGMEDGEKKLVIYPDPSTMSAQTDDYYAYGDITFTSGDNNGLSQNVKSYRASDRRVELQGPMPFVVNPGDTFSISAGCDKLRSTCIDKFSNINNNGGFGFIPGSDRVLQTPKR